MKRRGYLVVCTATQFPEEVLADSAEMEEKEELLSGAI